MATETAQHTRQDLLGVYLNDHLAGSTVGMGLRKGRMPEAQRPPADKISAQ